MVCFGRPSRGTHSYGDGPGILPVDGTSWFRHGAHHGRSPRGAPEGCGCTLGGQNAVSARNPGSPVLLSRAARREDSNVREPHAPVGLKPTGRVIERVQGWPARALEEGCPDDHAAAAQYTPADLEFGQRASCGRL